MAAFVASSDGFYKGIVNIATLEKALRGRRPRRRQRTGRQTDKKGVRRFNGGNGGIIFVLVPFMHRETPPVSTLHSDASLSSPTPIHIVDRGPLRARSVKLARITIEGISNDTTNHAAAAAAAAPRVRVGPLPSPPPPLSGSVLLNLPEWVGSDFAISLFSLNDLDRHAD